MEGSYCEVIGCDGCACWGLRELGEVGWEDYLCDAHWEQLRLRAPWRAHRYTRVPCDSNAQIAAGTRDGEGSSPAAETAPRGVSTAVFAQSRRTEQHLQQRGQYRRKALHRKRVLGLLQQEESRAKYLTGARLAFASDCQRSGATER